MARMNGCHMHVLSMVYVPGKPFLFLSHGLSNKGKMHRSKLDILAKKIIKKEKHHKLRFMCISRGGVAEIHYYIRGQTHENLPLLVINKNTLFSFQRLFFIVIT